MFDFKNLTFAVQSTLCALTLPPVAKTTGLAAINNEKLVSMLQEKGAFPQSWNPGIQIASWDYMIEQKALIKDPNLRPLKIALTQTLARSNLMELGIGDKFSQHRDFFTDRFHVRAFTAVERRDVVSHVGLLRGDVLLALSTVEDSSSNICAFGLFNEPLCPHHGFFLKARTPEKTGPGQIEHEYLRRLAHEIYRIIPTGGILFGDGLHPLRTQSSGFALARKYVFHEYLEAYGFRDIEGITDGLQRFNKELRADVFAYRKVVA